MNLPNLLTMVRLALIPVYLVVFFSDQPMRMYWALGIILLAGLTDVVDGYLARRNQQITQLGIMLDPLADKLMMIAVFLSLLISGKISFWAAVAIFFRDMTMILCSVIFHFRGKKTVPANMLGKLTTVLFYIALLLLMISSPGDSMWEIAQVFLWSVIALSYLTSIVYMFQLKMVNERFM
ncbi:CDP-diacylglycerol--glycerol-3-phosphate 3-phosphatidyltransferase [Paenactinomyces guangxiensis]|uniref:CDP-diacylglycerol--glycerol-3-phosphate 3-phosphatidyltransferase n=1 Tax=Paenactinomyces guangxiensis TaxID=1490290 RepID=A0A7W1WTW0_9BACL|nr:CDP-diacylglycerol--glycerol-3-phosphate 3-phosphatidyltransferase [Paenactinomyces guangxiensis]MBA4495981.1 CDP-diacylglycerol--glycerol-3-phosphate 3-phosphatidyltransferase [Paenactinomyces guangxiensis]MBH8593032.1 CDP-diacylglycerol--glycerol-3-phosphate 3-phosphatidyltransferase [Paenactinomyces guangxiensis]